MKITHPEENVIYTFVYDNGEKLSFKYLGTKPNGKLIMCLLANVGNNEYIEMTEKRFSFLYNRQLISEVKVSNSTPEDSITIQDYEKQKQESDLINKELAGICAWLRNLNGTCLEQAKKLIGINPLALADKIESANDSDIITYIELVEKLKKSFI